MNKKLYREEDNKIVAGVLAGAATYLNLDVVVLRLAFLLFLILSGVVPAVICYLVAWVIVPAAPHSHAARDADYTVTSE